MTLSSSDRIHVADAEGDEWTVLVAGDCVHQGNLAADPVAPSLVERITDADLSLANLEGPLPAEGTEVDKTGPRKRLVEEAPAMVADAGFDVVTLANNHVMDFGAAGLEATMAACHAADLQTVGAGEDIDDALEPLVVDVRGHTLAILDVCEKEFGVAGEDSPGTAWTSHPSVERRIVEATQTADVVIVVDHGGVEYTPLPPEQRQARLRSFVDAGADAVVGHHPHVPQGWEVYDGSPICYSLGNFLFDHAVRTKPDWGVVVELTFVDETLTGVDLVLTELVDGVVQPLGVDRDPTACLDHLHRLSEITADRDRLRAHWQELAVRVFAQRYTGWLRAATGAGLLQALRAPRAAFGTATWDPDRRQSDLLTLLNLVRNESHRAVIETTLAVKTGDDPDRRTPEIEREVRDMLSWTEDQSVYDRPSRPERMVRAVVGRLT